MQERKYLMSREYVTTNVGGVFAYEENGEFYLVADDSEKGFKKQVISKDLFEAMKREFK